MQKQISEFYEPKSSVGIIKPFAIRVNKTLSGKHRVSGIDIGVPVIPSVPLLVVQIFQTSYTATSKYITLYVRYLSKDFNSFKTTSFNIWDYECVDLLGEEECKELLALNKKDVIDKLESNLYHSFTVGSDPEMFCEDEKGQVIPAFEFLGSKTEGKNITGQCDYSGKKSLNVYWDGFQAEFETCANTCLAYHTDSVQIGLATLSAAMLKHNKKAKLSTKTLMQIPQEMIDSAKEEHVQFGCMPSFNVYGKEGMKRSGREVNYRTAGGHIHFGIGKKDQSTIDNIVKALDAIIGVACVSMFAKYDHPQRRQMYGLAGEYRLPEHGLEYRTLSNSWLLHPTLMNMVFDIARKALVVGEKDLLNDIWVATEEETTSCINSCNVDLAREILKRNEKMFLRIAKAAYPALDPQPVFNAFFNGCETVVENPENIAGNWNISKPWDIHGNSPGKNWNKTIIELSKGKKVA